MTVRKRPFTLYYGESTRTPVSEDNYHVRTRAATLISAVRAAVTRMHTMHDAARADIIDADHWHVATVIQRPHGFEVKFTAWAEKQHHSEMAVLKGDFRHRGIY